MNFRIGNSLMESREQRHPTCVGASDMHSQRGDLHRAEASAQSDIVELFGGMALRRVEDSLRLRVLLIGLGNEFRRDDGVGLLVAKAMRARSLPGVEVMELPGEGSALMEVWKNRERVFLFDASVSGAPQGTVTRLDATRGDLPVSFSLASSHAFSALEAVELARGLGQLPRSLVIYAIEGKDFAFGTEISQPVARAVRKVVSRVCLEIESSAKRTG